MRNIQSRVGAVAILAVLTLATTVLAAKRALDISAQDVSVDTNAALYRYVIEIDLPADVSDKRLDSVFLDFVLDVTPTEEGNGLWPAPMVGVFPLTSAFASGSLAYSRDVSSVRPVAVGQGRQVRMDITGIVKDWVSNPWRNHAVVIAMLRDTEDANLSLRNGVLRPGIAARVTFYYQNRFGDRMSSRPQN